MRTTVKATVQIDITESITCNKCGEFINKGCNYEYVEMDVYWGYGSKKDQEYHTSHICELCYDELIKTFKIPPTIRDYLP